MSTSPGDALLAEADAASVRPWVDQLVQDALPPLVETVIMTNDGAEVAHTALRQPYNKQRGDQNLSSRPDLFERLTAHLDWRTACSTALPRAQKLLKSRASIDQLPASGAAKVREMIYQRAHRERSRELAGLQHPGRDLSLLAASVPERLEPSVRVLGCGVIFVGDPSKLE